MCHLVSTARVKELIYNMLKCVHIEECMQTALDCRLDGCCVVDSIENPQQRGKPQRPQARQSNITTLLQKHRSD